MKRYRLAVLSSGAPNSWREGLMQVKDDFLPRLESIWSVRLDVQWFFDFWDFNVVSSHYENAEELKKAYGFSSDLEFDFIFPMSGEEQEEIFVKFRSASLKYHSVEEYKRIKSLVVEQRKSRFNIPGYLMRCVGRARRAYERDNGPFDAVLWVRPDVSLYLQDELLPKPERGILYTRGEWGVHVKAQGTKDLYFYGTPESVDLAFFVYPGDRFEYPGDGRYISDECNMCVELEFGKALGKENIKLCNISRSLNHGLVRGFEEQLYRGLEQEEETREMSIV